MSCPICSVAIADESLLNRHVNEHLDGEMNDLQDAVPASSFDFESATPSLSQTLSNLSESEVLANLCAESDARSARNKRSFATMSTNGDVENTDDNEQSSVAANASTSRSHSSNGHAASSSSAAPYELPSRKADGTPIHDVATVRGVVTLLHAHIPAQSRVRRVALCSDIDQFESRWDRGWGCGYRNLQQFLSCLARNAAFASRLFSTTASTVLAIADIQRAIENAWHAGFDEKGFRELRSVVGKRSWIGTTEVVAVLRYCGINARIGAFARPCGADELSDVTGGNDTLRASRRSKTNTHFALVAWLMRHFDSNGAVATSWSGQPRTNAKTKSNKGVDRDQLRIDNFFSTHNNRTPSSPQRPATPPRRTSSPNTSFVPPVFLQHQGHSRTVIGYEQCADGTVNLLILDPSSRGLLGSVRAGKVQLLRRGEHTMTKPQYEVVFIDMKKPFLNDVERDASKHLSSDFLQPQ